MTTDELFRLAGRTAVITGGTRGIGRSVAESFLRQGAEVVVTTRRPERIEAARNELGELGKIHVLVADLDTPAGVQRFIEQVRERFAVVHILVNNAGTNWGAPLVSYPPDAFARVMQVDAIAPFQLVQGLLPVLEAGASDTDPARVINIGSVDGHSAGPFENYGYAAAKAALHHLTAVLARELGSRRITVNCLALGPILTKMTSALLEAEGDRLIRNNPLGRLGRPEDVQAPLLMLAGPGGSYVTGAVIPVDGGYGISRWCDA